MEVRMLNLFVYGTLRTGQPLHDWLEDSILHRREAKIKGDLYPTYNGKFPVANVYGKGIIVGEVFICRVTDAVRAIINMELRAGYEILEVPLVNKVGNPIGTKAFVFHYPYRLPNTEPIESGDWVLYVNQKG